MLEQLRIAARSDGASPKSFALLLRRVFEERAWKQEGFATFGDYVKADEPYGLGMTEEKLLDAARLAGVEGLARSLLYKEKLEAPDRSRGGDRRSAEFQMRGAHLKSQPQTDTTDRVVRRLKRDDPEMAVEVISGKITANAAAQKKGWRKPRIVLSTPERIAGSLRKHMPRESLLRLVELLTKED